MTILPWVLLASTLAVRLLLSRKSRLGFWLDLMTVVPWLAFYVSKGAYPLLPVPVLFGLMDLRALTRWWK